MAHIDWRVCDHGSTFFYHDSVISVGHVELVSNQIIIYQCYGWLLMLKQDATCILCKLMLYGNLHLQHVGCWMCPYIVQYMYICKTFYMYTQVQFYLYMKCTNIHTYMYMCPSSHILCKVPVSLPYLISTAPKCLQAVSLRASNCRHDTTRRHGRNLTPVASRQNAV